MGLCWWLWGGDSPGPPESAEVDPSPAVQGDVPRHSWLCPTWAGPLHVKTQLVCSQSFVPPLSMWSPPPGANDWVNCHEESCSFDVLAIEQGCSSASSAVVVLGLSL